MALKYSRQRHAIWENIKGRKDHPTADVIYNTVRRDYPNISLGTVYRNLMVLKDLGMIRTVDVGDGVIHFDPNVAPHDHFVCTRCGRIYDIEGIDGDKIRAAAASHFPGTIERYSACFYGVCPDCLAESAVSLSGKNI